MTVLNYLLSLPNIGKNTVCCTVMFNDIRISYFTIKLICILVSQSDTFSNKSIIC